MYGQNTKKLFNKGDFVMIFQNNVMKEYLKNVYFITGTPCGGKTTLSHALAQKYGFELFDIDERFEEHKKISDPLFQPAMNTSFKSADEFFGRTVEEYKNWLLKNTREQLEFVLLDLIRLSGNKRVLCDCHLTVAQALAFSEPARVVFLIKDPSNLVEEYGNRPDHQGFFQYLNSATDIEKAKQTVNTTLYELNADRIEEIKRSPFFWIERTADSTLEDTVACVEKHFCLQVTS